MDEFFDFAKLEQDGNSGVHCQGTLFSENADALLALDSIMDWQPTIPDGTNILAALPSECMYDGLMQLPANLDHPNHRPFPGAVDLAHPQPCVNDIAMDTATRLSWPIRETNSARHKEPCLSDMAASPQYVAADSPNRPHRAGPPTPIQRTATMTRKPASATRKGASSRIPLEAKQMLEDEFAANPYPCSWEIDIIAHQANLDVKRVRNWYNNTRARKKPSDKLESSLPKASTSTSSLASQLSRDSLEALDKQTDETIEPPQPPLALYLAQSYQEEAVTFSVIQAAMDNGSLSDISDTQVDTWSSRRVGRAGSVITSITSSDGTAPTTYSSGSNMSSFNRDRRRGRRRMEWKSSPYTRTKLNGLDSAGVPQENLPFCCTFCPRAFKTKYEWIRHEDSVHALRTTWICCDSKSAPLLSCPFCGQLRPDEHHMASHKYQQCKNKPESQRTFYRRDHFIQHLHHVHFANAKHPSARLGCQVRHMDGEGNNFGCKDLAIKWRRFGAPIKTDDPMLHCGFCGKKSKTWSERCEHVAEHMYAGELDRSAWWSDRLENHLENLIVPDAGGPFRCRYCRKLFATNDAMNEHSHCRVWSCRFLLTFDDVAAENAGPPLCPQFPSPKAHHCHLCGAGYRSLHVEHAQHYHRYRQCDQHLYTSEDDFLQHLFDHHSASLPTLLKGNHIVEQNFSRNKGASFEPLEDDHGLQSCHFALLRASPVDQTVAKKALQTTPVMDEATKTMALPVKSSRKIAPDTASTSTKKSAKTQRKGTDSSNSKSASQGPRFFRLSSLVPFLSSRILYLRSTVASNPIPDSNTALEEVRKGHVATLAMSAGLVGMAGVRFPLNMRRDGVKGAVEFKLDEEDE